MKLKKLLSFIPFLVTMALIGIMFSTMDTLNTENWDYRKLIDNIETKTIDSVEINPLSTVIEISGTYTEKDVKHNFKAIIPNTEAQNNNLMELLEQRIRDGEIVVKNPNEMNILAQILIQFLPILLTLGLGVFLFSKMSGSSNSKAFEFSKSRAQLQDNIKVRFSDVAGCEEEKEEVAELITYLRNPDRYTKMGAHMPKGCLMVGPPGTGKTLLAKAVAGEADVPFYSISGSDFVELFVGVGASRVRDMFKEAKKTAPCIIFIDEIDAVGRQRGAGLGGGNDEREQTLNQLLVEMDGIGENTGIIILAATNRPDVLDPALLRAGRFDRQITVSLPDKKGRKAILNVHSKNKKFDKDVDLESIAAKTPGFAGADLENVLNEAAIMAIREKRSDISMDNLEEAIDRVMAGPAKKSKKYSDKEKYMVAVHEAGHAVIGLFYEQANVVEKVTIIPRGIAGGYNLMTPKEETLLKTKTDLEGEIVGLLGGRVAEELVLNEISTGASNDIERATKIARAMVSIYGMSTIGPIQYGRDDESVFLGRDYTNNKNLSDQVASEIDSEIRKLINESYAIATRVIREHRQDLDNIVKALMERETLSREEIDLIAKTGTLEVKEETTLAEPETEQPKETPEQ